MNVSEITFKTMGDNFNCNTSLTDGERYEIKGLNIWDYTWKSTGECFSVKEPVRQQQLRMPIYQITNGEVTARFAVTEVSNNVYLVYHKY